MSKPGEFGEPWKEDCDGFTVNSSGESPYRCADVRERIRACVNALDGCKPAEPARLLDAAHLAIVTFSKCQARDNLESALAAFRGEA